jgi:hypothetical protein
MRAVNLCVDALERHLRCLFCELGTAQTLAQRVASTWAIRSHLDYMVFLGVEAKADLLDQCDTFIDKALPLLLRTDPEGFEFLEQAVWLCQQEQRQLGVVT